MRPFGSGLREKWKFSRSRHSHDKSMTGIPTFTWFGRQPLRRASNRAGCAVAMRPVHGRPKAAFPVAAA
ncbi:MAG: hypothetical protein BGP23_10865 [Lysobacterales bacterium 66-474]|nr:MAG: hypothetical protein ABT18_03525 [Rhodanobacter sp. SCN 66-43]OJY85277.1 MAG: hypothetical protein BGP23_10865 [Xanthomonadales bacterium 66-474]